MQTPAEPLKKGPLEGITVLDFSRVLAGPTAPWCWPTSARG
ncbi:MAG: hypothetical protein WDM92_00660 [Caulobacteraceae bacterium]